MGILKHSLFWCLLVVFFGSQVVAQSDLQSESLQSERQFEELKCPEPSSKFKTADYSLTKRLKLRVKGLDENFYTLILKIGCRKINGELTSYARVVSDEGFVNSFNVSLKKAKISKIDFLSNLDDFTGAATPVMTILIGDQLNFNVLVAVSFRWGEREPKEFGFKRHYTFFQSHYSVYYYVRHKETFEQQRWANHVPLDIDFDRSEALFDKKVIKLRPQPR